MSQDQAPEKVKLYSGGSGGRPGVRAVSGGGAAGQRRRADAAAPAAALAALPAPAEAQSGAVNWLALILFVLGCAVGGALFTLLMPF